MMTVIFRNLTLEAKFSGQTMMAPEGVIGILAATMGAEALTEAISDVLWVDGITRTDFGPSVGLTTYQAFREDFCLPVLS